MSKTIINFLLSLFKEHILHTEKDQSYFNRTGVGTVLKVELDSCLGFTEAPESLYQIIGEK